jgi:2-succinyl-5-enolpyruvyl-6-hydroxy-3-cyclohexene-1-carboxylate synthase
VTPPRPNPSTLLARTVLDELLAAGVTEVVLAPGSRNAPLAFAAGEAARLGRLRLHTRIDERSAGFLALGMTRVAAPAVVMCTSGTAVANLLPAVLEAAHSGLPLVVLTADRPARLRGTDANQTTDQVRIFGDAAAFLDLDADSPHDELAGLVAGLGRDCRPVHLNLQLDLPLVPDVPWARSAAVRPAPEAVPGAAPGDPSARRSAGLPEQGGAVTLDPGPRTVVVAGDDAGPGARILAEQAGWPLLAEPTSGARTGTHALRTYRLLLDGELGGRVERVVVAGHPTLSRPVTRLLEREDVEVVAVRRPGRWSERSFPVSRTVGALRAVADPDPEWLAAWQEADRATSQALDRLLGAEADLTPHEVAGAVSAAVPPEGMLFVGASSPIRDLDLMARPYPVGERRKVIANRGLAGIDGTTSSAIGAALARSHGSRNLALLGDVTFLHDSNGLVLGPREPRPDLTIVVVNDDGGSIFAMLEQGDPRYAEHYDTLFGTPHGVDVASLCAATRTPHWRVGSLAELEHALAGPAGGIEVVEVVVRRDNRRELDERIRALGR